MATQILVNVDQKRAILAGKNVEQSRVRIPVDIPTLDAKYRKFLADHVDTKDLSLPSNGSTQYLTVVGDTQQDLLDAIDEAMTIFETKQAEGKVRRAEGLAKVEAAYQDILEKQSVERERNSTSEKIVHEGEELTIHYAKTIPLNVWAGPYENEGEYKDSVKAIREKYAAMPEWQQLLDKCAAETEKARAAAIAGAIADREKKKLEEEVEKEVLRMWTFLPNHDSVDMEMAEEGLIEHGQASEDILGFLFPERASDVSEPNYLPEKGDFGKQAFLAYRTAEKEAKARLKDQMGDNFYTLEIPMDSIEVWNNVGQYDNKDITTIQVLVYVRSTRLNTVIIRDRVELVVGEE